MSKRQRRRRQFRLRSFGLAVPADSPCGKAAVILERTHDSSDALLGAFETAWKARGRKRGVSTDEEQDLLRAMLVLAAAGLDSTLKQLIRDAMPALVRKNATVREGLEKFTVRSIRGDAENPESLPAARFLGRILAAESTQVAVIEGYIRDLTGASLQSADELARASQALGLSTRVDMKQFREIFDIRNKIIHELDINLEGDRRKRHERRREPMMKYANALLEIGEQVVREVAQSLTASGMPALSASADPLALARAASRRR